MTETDTTISIGNRRVGPGHPAFIIAEVSANHGHSLERTLELVAVAAECGADAVKVQTYTADGMTIDSDLPHFVVGPGNPWSGRRLHELYEDAAMPWEWYPHLVDAAAQHGIVLFSTPFDRAGVDFLVGHDTDVLKIASFEITDIPLIEAAAATGLPLIMSTGMATIQEINDAVHAARTHGDGGVALLRCNSAYPSPIDQMDLRTITDLAERWKVPVGLSDHTLDSTSATVSVALGASIIEKHFTMRRSDGGPDSSFSLEPHELRALVEQLRAAEAALGNVRYGPSESDRPSLAFRRSLYVISPVAAGDTFTYKNVGSRRPTGVLPPKHLPEVIGKHARTALPVGHSLTWDDLA